MNERMKLLEALSAADFAVIETRLFLDTHPCDSEALAALCEYEKKAACCRRAYESRYGSLTGSDACEQAEQCGAWQWVDDPWPWQCV